MKTTKSARFALAMVYAVSCMLLMPGTARAQVTMTNNLTTVRFVTPPIYPTDPAYEVQYVKNVATGATGNQINFRQSNTMSSGYCGTWSIQLRDRVAANALTNYLWFDVASLRQSGATVNVTAQQTGNGNPNVVQKYLVTFDVTGLAFMNVTAHLKVLAQWRLDPGSPYVSAQISILDFYDVNNPSHLLSQLPYYVSSVKFPSLYVDYPVNSNDVHQLLMPFAGGLLMQDPALHGTSNFPTIVNGPGNGSDGKFFGAVAMTPPLLAYYDETTSDCLYMTDDDLSQLWRDFEVTRNTDPNGNYVIEMRARHMPDNVYARDTYTTLYSVRIAPMVGDWVDVASTYRAFIADPNNYPSGVYKFYRDPVGASTNGMSSDFKNLVLHTHLGSGVDLGTDSMDDFARNEFSSRRIALGTGEMSIWSAGFFPDFTDNMYYDFPNALGYDGYLPGRPSFAAAVRESQKPIGTQTGTIVATFLSSWGGIDWFASGLPMTTQSDVLHRDAQVSEDGSSDPGPTGAGYYVVDGCNGQYQAYAPPPLGSSSTWSNLFEDYVLDIVAHTGAHAFDCDAFNTGPCFSTTHAKHLPGGGNYMFVNREKQIQDIKNNATSRGASISGATMEGAFLDYVGDIDLMHESPTITSITDVNLQLVTNVKIIPFFRMVADCVKLSSFYDNPTYSDTGRRAWLNAMETFVYGNIPHATNYLADYVPTYGAEVSRTDAPFQRYLRRMVHFLRDTTAPATWSFLKFHNGTLQRTPAFTVFNPSSTWSGTLGFGNGTNYNDPVAAANQYLVVGMYKAPQTGTTKDFALVVTNPWVGVGAPNFELRSCLFDPARYGLTTYTVTRYDDAGNATSYGLMSGQYTIPNTPIPPGQIWYWVFSG